MNKKQIVIEVVKHPLIKSIKKLNLIESKTLSQMIARSLEEILSEEEEDEEPSGYSNTIAKTAEDMEGPLQTATVKLAKAAGVETESDYTLLPHRQYYQAVFFQEKSPKDAFLDRFNSGDGLTDQAVKRLVNEIPKILKQEPSDDAEKIALEMLKGLLEAIQETQAKTAPLPDGVQPALERVIDLLKEKKYAELLKAIQELKNLLSPKQLTQNNLQESEEDPAQLLLNMLNSIQKGNKVDASALLITVSNLENQVKAELEKTKKPEGDQDEQDQQTGGEDAQDEEADEEDGQDQDVQKPSEEIKKSYINTYEMFVKEFPKSRTLQQQAGVLQNYYRVIKVLSGKDVPKFGDQAKAYTKTLGENKDKKVEDSIIVTSNVVLKHMDKIEDILDAYKEQTEAGTVGSNRLFMKYGEGNPKKFLMKILGLALKDINALVAGLEKSLAPPEPKEPSEPKIGAKSQSLPDEKEDPKDVLNENEEESVEDIINIVSDAYEKIVEEGDKILNTFKQTAKDELRNEEDNSKAFEDSSIKQQAERVYDLIEPITKYFPSINPFGTNYGHDQVLEDFKATVKGLVSLVTQINRYAKDGDINQSIARSAIQKFQEIKSFLKERFGISDAAKKADKTGALNQEGEGENYTKSLIAKLTDESFTLRGPDGLVNPKYFTSGALKSPIEYTNNIIKRFKQYTEQIPPDELEELVNNSAFKKFLMSYYSMLNPLPDPPEDNEKNLDESLEFDGRKLFPRSILYDIEAVLGLNTYAKAIQTLKTLVNKLGFNLVKKILNPSDFESKLEKYRSKQNISSQTKIPKAPDDLEPEEEIDMSDDDELRSDPNSNVAFAGVNPAKAPEDREPVEELPSKKELESERHKQGRKFAIYLEKTGNLKVPEWGNTEYPPWLFLSMFVRYWTFLKNPINVDLDETKRGKKSNKPKDLPAKISAIIGVDAYNKIESDYRRTTPIQGLASVSSTSMSKKNKVKPLKAFQITMSLIGQLLDSGKTSQIMKDFLENGKIDIPEEQRRIEERIASKLKPIIERMLNG